MVPNAAMLIVAGLQVPFIALLDTAGSVGAVLFKQRGPIASNTGVTDAAIVMLIVTGVLHNPAAGVKV